MLGKIPYLIKILDTYFLVMGAQPLVTSISNNSMKANKLTIINILMTAMLIMAAITLVSINHEDLLMFKQQLKYGIANTVFIINQKLILLLVVFVIVDKIRKIDSHIYVYRDNIKFMLITFEFECADLLVHYRKVRNLLLTNLLTIVYNVTILIEFFVMHVTSSAFQNDFGVLYNILLLFYAYYPFFYANTNMTMFLSGIRMQNFYLMNLNRVLNVKIRDFNHPNEIVKTSVRNKGFRDQCTELNDIIMRVHYLHCKLKHTIRRWTDLNAFSVLVYNMDSFLTLAFRPFYIYTMCTKTQSDVTEECDFLKLAVSLHIILTKIFDSTVIMSNCQRLIDNSGDTGNILHTIDLKRIDGRLKDTIKLFSIQMLQDPLSLTPFGLFSMGYKLWFMILSSSVAYFIILVQFQIEIK